MKQGRLLWTPYPYRAGFCITDDTDNADLESVRIVYDFLRDRGIRTTKTVWAFRPEEPSGVPPAPRSTLRGITLEDPNYLSYCKELRSSGFEIALHGASAGNNRRERTKEGFSVLLNEFGSDGTFICHAKNAENIYWEEKCGLTKLEQSLIHRFSGYTTYGEDEKSPYFWGDLCRQYVSQIRLFRTRCTNTLSVNPSMPYYDQRKPWVRSWFSATKRSFHDCTKPEALERLIDENGLTVLYQYMHRYADRSTQKPESRFCADAERLVANSKILVDTTARIMNRLRTIQGIFIGHFNERVWLINTKGVPVEGLQIAIPDGVQIVQADQSQAKTEVKEVEPGLLLIEHLAPERCVELCFQQPVWIESRQSFSFDQTGKGECYFGHGLFEAQVPKEGDTMRWRVVFQFGLEDLKPTSKISDLEYRELFYGQAWIILREIFQRKRTMSYEDYLNDSSPLLENHEHW